MSREEGSPFCHSCGTDPGWEQKIIQSKGVGICSMCVEIMHEARVGGIPLSLKNRTGNMQCDFCSKFFAISKLNHSNGLAICAPCNQICFEVLHGQRPCPLNWKVVANNKE